MSILWCGGEDIDFPNGAAPTSYAGAYRSNYARVAMQPPSGSAVFVKSTVFPGGEATSAWFSFRAYRGSPSTNAGWWGLGKSGTSKGIFVGNGSSQGKLAILKYDGSSWSVLAQEDGASMPYMSLQKIDLEIVSYGGSSTIRLYYNGSLLVTFNGDSSISGVSGFDSVFGYRHTTGGDDYCIGSEFIVADEDTRSMSLCTMYPNAAGDANAWNGTYADIDEAAAADSDNMNVNSNGQAFQVNLTTIPSGNFSIPHMKISARAARASSATPTKLKMGVKHSGTINLDAGSSVASNWTTYERHMPLNPVTSAAWLDSQMAALQLAMESAA